MVCEVLGVHDKDLAALYPVQQRLEILSLTGLPLCPRYILTHSGHSVSN